MDFADTSDEADFRAKVRAWLAEAAAEYRERPAEPWSEDELVARGRKWLRAKSEAGFGAIEWPAHIGGMGGTIIDATIFAEEESRYHLPIAPFATIGMNMAIPGLIKHGTAEQLARFARPTREGALLWCQLFSEPAAGSDLAAVRTRAVRQGDDWIVNGQKVWSSWAHQADWGILLARTDPTLPKHKGLTFFLVDMKSAGIAIRPIRQLNGKSDFNETFLTDLVVPDACRVGAEGDGWAVAMTVLTGERLSSSEESGDVRALIDHVLRRGEPDAFVRERLAAFYARQQGERYLRLRLLTRASKGLPLGAEAAAIKLVYADRLQQQSAFALDLVGFGGAVTGRGDGFHDQIVEDYLWAPAMRIAGGADEVLRNQIAERILGMPAEHRLDKNLPFAQLDRA